MNRNQINLLFLSLLILAGCSSTKKEKDVEIKSPNVIFIAIDDLRSELGCYGNEVIQTLNLDKLASSGTAFTNHFVQVPTCGASRFSLLTGRRPSKMTHLGNDAIEKEISDLPENEMPESFVHHLRRNGYYTVGIGKISHSSDGLLYGYEDSVSTKRELPHSWDERPFDAGKWETGWNAMFAYADGENRQSMKKQVKPYEAGEVDDDGYPDGLTTNLALIKLRELKDQTKPFFLGVGYFKPHLPFNAPKKYWDLYERDSIPISSNPYIPKNINKKMSLHQSGEFNNNYHLGDEKPSLENPVSDDYARKLNHAYYAAVSYIDAQVGILIEEVNKLGLAQNTIIVVWGDHGWHLGDQRVWGKHTLFENALRSTLIINVPGTKHATNSNSKIVETVDIYPTLMELCGVAPPNNLDGESLVDLISDVNANHENLAYSYWRNGMGLTLRTEKYRLTKFINDKEPIFELYDHVKDPMETINIAANYPKIIEELLPLLEKGHDGF